MWTKENVNISNILDVENDEQLAQSVTQAWENTVAKVLRTLYRKEGILGILQREKKFDPSLQVDVLNTIRPEFLKQQSAANDENFSDDLLATGND